MKRFFTLLFLVIPVVVFGQGTVRTYDTVAQMTNQIPGQVSTGGKITAEVRGYWVPGDSGGGSFTWTANLTNDVDKGVFFPAIGSGRWERNDKANLNVNMFGAKGDFDELTQTGTDNTEIFNQAKQAAFGLRTSLDIPGGNYMIDHLVITNNTFTMRGSPKGQTVLFINSETANGIHVMGTHVTLEDIVVSSTALRTNVPPSTVGTNLNGILYLDSDFVGTYLTLRRVVVFNQPGNGLAIAGGMEQAWVEQSNFQSNKKSGVAGVVVATFGGFQNSFQNCRLLGNWEYGLDLQNSTCWTFSNCEFLNNGPKYEIRLNLCNQIVFDNPDVEGFNYNGNTITVSPPTAINFDFNTIICPSCDFTALGFRTNAWVTVANSTSADGAYWITAVGTTNLTVEPSLATLLFGGSETDVTLQWTDSPVGIVDIAGIGNHINSGTFNSLCLPVAISGGRDCTVDMIRYGNFGANDPFMPMGVLVSGPGSFRHGNKVFAQSTLQTANRPALDRDWTTSTNLLLIGNEVQGRFTIKTPNANRGLWLKREDVDETYGLYVANGLFGVTDEKRGTVNFLSSAVLTNQAGFWIGDQGNFHIMNSAHLHAPSRTGSTAPVNNTATNKAGADLYLDAGTGTGTNGTLGNVIFTTPRILVGGDTTAQPSTERFRIKTEGQLHLVNMVLPSIAVTDGDIFFGTNAGSLDFWFRKTNTWVGLGGGGGGGGSSVTYNNGVTNNAGVVQWNVAYGTGISGSTNNGKITLSAISTGLTNGTAVFADGAGPQISINLGDSSTINGALTGTNWAYDLIDGTLTTNKLNTTFYSLLIATNGSIVKVNAGSQIPIVSLDSSSIILFAESAGSVTATIANGSISTNLLNSQVYNLLIQTNSGGGSTGSVVRVNAGPVIPDASFDSSSYLSFFNSVGSITGTINNGSISTNLLNSQVYNLLIQTNGSGGGSVTNLDDLGDVTITSPTTNQVLAYNGSQWVNTTPSGGGGSTNITGPLSSTDNAVVRWDGTTGSVIQNSSVIMQDDGATVIGTNTTGNPFFTVYGTNTQAHNTQGGYMTLREYAGTQNNNVMFGALSNSLASQTANVRVQVDWWASTNANTHIGFNVGGTANSSVVVKRQTGVGDSYIGIRGIGYELGTDLSEEAQLLMTSTGFGISTLKGKIALIPDSGVTQIQGNTGVTTPAAGEGLEIRVDSDDTSLGGGTLADVLTFDRTGNLWGGLRISGSNLVLRSGSNEGLRVSDPGNVQILKTNFVSEIYVTNGITLGGVRNTSWPSGGGGATNDTWGVYRAGTPVTNANFISSANATVSGSSVSNITYTFTGVGSATNGYLLKSATIITNTSNAGEFLVWDFNLPANTLSEDGDELEFYTSGLFLNNSGGAGGYTWKFYADGAVSPVLSGNLSGTFPDISSDKSVEWRMRMRRLSNTSAFLIVDHIVGDEVGSTGTNYFRTQLRKTTPIVAITGFDGAENFAFSVQNSGANANLGHTLYGYTVHKIASAGGNLPVSTTALNVLPSVASSATNHVLDFNYRGMTLTVTNNVNFIQSTNRPTVSTNMLDCIVKLVGDTVDRTLSWNSSWIRLGTNISTIPSNKVVVLSAVVYGTAETGVVFGLGKQE